MSSFFSFRAHATGPELWNAQLPSYKLRALIFLLTLSIKQVLSVFFVLSSRLLLLTWHILLCCRLAVPFLAQVELFKN